MAQTNLTLDTLGDLDDGTIRHLVDTALHEALADCESRPGLEKVRGVTITVALKPVLSERGGLKGVHTEVRAKTSLPSRVGRMEYLPTSVTGDTVTAQLPNAYPRPMFPTETTEGDAS